MFQKIDKTSLLYFGTIFFVCVYTLMDSYFFNVFISPDTASYLREAENLYNGYGFNNNGLAGGEGWFSLFPILHPILICCFMLITGANAYLSSKFLCCFCLVVLSIFFKLKFEKNYIFYSLFFLNFGFIWCMLYSWSEIPFILFVVLAVFAIYEFVDGHVNFHQCLKILVPSVLAFLTRYYGLFLFFVVGWWALTLIIEKKKAGVKLLIVDFVFIILSSVYLYVNNMMSGFATGGKRFVCSENYWDLTKNLFQALIAEIWGFFGNLIHGAIFLKDGILVPMQIITVICLGLVSVILWRKTDVLKAELPLRAKVFFVSGILYYVIFIVYRYMSTMDPFSYRFFIPGTILLFVGFVDVIRNVRINKFVWRGITLGILLLVASYSVLGLTYYKKNGFLETTRLWKEKYEWMIPLSKVVFCYPNISFHPGLMWFRKDILFVVFQNEEMFLKDKNIGTVYVDKRITECAAISNTDPHMLDEIRNSPEKLNFWILNE